MPAVAVILQFLRCIDPNDHFETFLGSVVGHGANCRMLSGAIASLTFSTE